MAALTPMVAGQRHSTERHRMLDRRKSITFKEKLFYLDLPHTKHTQLLTKAICRLGGVIEGFLSRDVNYVVTGSRKALDIANGSAVAGRRGGHCKRQAAENIEPALCRGKQLLKKAIQNQEHSSVLANAHSWGVCILHVDEVLEYLKHSKNSASKTAQGNGAGKTVKVGKLKSPFLKIEDQSRKYRPLQCCFSNFPEISFISSDRSPFETARTNNSTHKEKDAGDQEYDDGQRSQRPHAREKSGYCECCQVAYTKLCEHLISERHGQFALDPSNYRVIDDIACHILCDFMDYPHGIMPVLERDVGDGPVSTEDAWNCVVKEESKIGVPEEPCQENGAVIPVEEDNTVNDVGEEHMPVVAHTQPVNNSATGEQEEDMDVTMHDGGPIEDKDQRHPFVEDANDLIQCNEPLQEICDTGAASHVDVVTEVSWYTEEAGLTSVYTVQSLVIPPHGQHAQLTMANTLATFTPPLLLGPLPNPQGAQGTERLSEVHNEPGLEDPLPVAQMTNPTGAHCSELLVKQTSLLEVHEQQELFAEPSTGNLCEVQLLDALVQLPALERRSEEMLEVQLGSIRLQEQLVLSGDQNESLLNASAGLHTQVDRALFPGQLNVIPLSDGPADTLVLTPSPTLLTNHSDREDRNQLNVIPLAQGFAYIAAVTQGDTPLGNEDCALEQNQLKVIPLCQGTAEVAQGTTPLGHETSALQRNQLSVIPLCQGTAEVAQGNTPLGNEASALQRNQLNVIPLCQDPAEVEQGTTPLGHETNALQRNQLNVIPLCQGTAEVAQGNTPLGNEASALQQNQLNVIPLCQGTADTAEVAQGNTPLGNEASALQQNQLNVIPMCQVPAVTHSTRTLDNKASTPQQNQLQFTTVVCRGKRRHSWSSSPPTAKRQPCQYQPFSLPMWVFHQVPDSRLQPAAHGFPDLMKNAEGTVNTPSPSFSPKLIQYDASSEPDWDLGLLSQQQCKHQQAAHLGDLRTAQVNLDESWYGRQLCSVLAEDQNLGSSTTQPVTLANTSYDLYLSEVAS